MIADATGTTVWKWDQQEPFGNTVADENPSGIGAFDLPLRLPGQYFDKETNLHYNYFRDYDPSIGIYKQSDLIGLRGGLNTYAYAFDPLKTIDPLGLMGFGGGGSATTAKSVPKLTEPQAMYFGMEGFYAPPGQPGAGLGITWLTCTDECGKKHTYRYKKVCVSAFSGFGVSMGWVRGMNGKNCKPGRYEDYFGEFGY